MSDSTNLLCPKCRSKRTAVDPYDNSQWHCFACEKTFRSSDDEPLTLFLSYGHPEEKIATHIKGALEEREGEAWMDKFEIKSGDDWREKIAEGVRNCIGVIACLSEYSMRPGGVCRDELAIAVANPACTVLPVLLDDEKEVDPPATITHIQWVDMHDWREHEDNQGWVDGRMQELREAIERQEIREFYREVKRLGEALQPRFNVWRESRLINSKFVGREWLTDKVVEWLDDRNSPKNVCLLTGSPGTGKSAFAAHFAHFGTGIGLQSRVATALFCEANNPIHNDARQVIRTLAFLLACRVPEYRMELKERIGDRQLPEMSEDELFSFLLAGPLSLTVDGNRECLCLVVDGLDEAGDSETNALANVLGRCADGFPEWLKVLVVSRKVSAVTAPFEGACRIDIDDSPEWNATDVRNYLNEVLRHRFPDNPNFDTRVESIVDASRGVMLYASLFADSIVEGETLEDACSALPKGLPGMFYRWFSRAFKEGDYKSQFRGALDCLLAAPGGALPEEELERLFSWNADKVNDFKRRLEVFLQEKSLLLGGPALSIPDAYLAEWLGSEKAKTFQATEATGTEKMAETFLAILNEDGADELTDYEAVHLLDLLKQSNKIKGKDYDHARSDPALCRRITSLCKSLLRDDENTLRVERIARASLRHFRDAPELPPESLVDMLYLEADVLRRQDDYPEAIELEKEVLGIYEELAKDKPDAFLPKIADAYSDLAERLQETNWGQDEVEECCRNAYKYYKQLAESEPANTVRKSKMIEAGSCLGRAFHANHQYDKAEKLLGESVSYFEDHLSENTPTSDLARLRTDWALALQETGKKENLAKAKDIHRQACNDFRKLVADGRRDCRASFADSCYYCATFCMADERFEQAEGFFIRQLKISRELAKDDPFEYWRNVAMSHIKLALLYEIEKKPDEAKAHHKWAATIYEDNYEQQLYYPDYADDLPESYSKLADFYEKVDKLDEAEEFYRQAIEAYEDPTKPKWGYSDPRKREFYERPRLQIAETCLDLASLLKSRKNNGEALSCCHKAVDECVGVETRDIPDREESLKNNIGRANQLMGGMGERLIDRIPHEQRERFQEMLDEKTPEEKQAERDKKKKELKETLGDRLEPASS